MKYAAHELQNFKNTQLTIVAKSRTLSHKHSLTTLAFTLFYTPFLEEMWDMTM